MHINIVYKSEKRLQLAIKYDNYDKEHKRFRKGYKKLAVNIIKKSSWKRIIGLYTVYKMSSIGHRSYVLKECTYRATDT